MIRKYLVRSGAVIMAVLAIAVALYSLRYYGALVNTWLDVDPMLRAVIQQVPMQALTHMLIAPVALLLGPFQFFPALRAKYPQAHRWSGRVYIAACVIAGTGALATTPYASGGPVAGLGFGILAVLLGRHDARRLACRRAAQIRTSSSADALQLCDDLRRGDIASANSGRIRARICELFGDVGWLAYTSWIPNVIVVALYSMAEALRRPAATVTPIRA